MYTLGRLIRLAIVSLAAAAAIAFAVVTFEQLTTPPTDVQSPHAIPAPAHGRA